MEFPQARLLVFAKAPVPGQVKTRLAGKYGIRGAARLYQAMLRRTLAMATAAALCPVQLWCAPNTTHPFFASCRRDYGVTLKTQPGGDLGRRMDLALRQALRESSWAVLIGGDCPSLGSAELRTALSALAGVRDAVLGPAEDGGYVLIGLRRPCPVLFQGVAWGKPGVLAATRRRLQRAGMAWSELPTGWDVDYPADVRHLKRSGFTVPGV